MDSTQLNWIANFIWGIADDVLRDLYTRGKYRDVILPMVVLRRLDSLLEDKQQAVLAMKATLDKNGVTNQEQALRTASGQAFYNTSPFTLRDLRARASQQQLRQDFEAYLNGFSANVQEILTNFEFRNQIPKLSKADALGGLIEKFLSPDVNLSPRPVHDADGRIKHPGLDNHAMGTVFEELVRRFNEDNNEEAGEHWTPRDAVKLMAMLIFRPIADQIESGTYLLYDGACGTGGMLTVAEETLQDLAAQSGKQVSTHLFGQELNAETYAIAKADLLLKGEGEAADNLVGGPEYSTLVNDAFPSREFDFMLSNPPYGKSWKGDLERMGGKANVKDARFVVQHQDEELKLLTRSSDAQMMFLANKIAKMKHGSRMGSRIAEVHNGSSLFTGDAGSGESNIRRWILENDWLEAIVALPLNMFYNTGIATYIWVLSNRKPEHRKCKVQLIDATQWFRPLRKNLGKKNCELAPEDMERITRTFLDFKETEESKIFANEAFGYWKVRVERPLRLRCQITRKAVERLRYASGDEALREEIHEQIGEALFEDPGSVKKELMALLDRWSEAGGGEEEDDEPGRKALPAAKRKKLADLSTWKRDARLVELGYQLRDAIGEEVVLDANRFNAQVDEVLDGIRPAIKAPERKALLAAFSERDETAEPVIKKVHKKTAVADPLHGLFEVAVNGQTRVVEYETDAELKDTEQVPLLEEGGIEAFIRREVLPYTPDAWIVESDTKIGYEISFTRHFYKPPVLRSLDEIKADILAVEQETEGLLEEIVGEIAT